MDMCCGCFHMPVSSMNHLNQKRIAENRHIGYTYTPTVYTCLFREDYDFIRRVPSCLMTCWLFCILYTKNASIPFS